MDFIATYLGLREKTKNLNDYKQLTPDPERKRLRKSSKWSNITLPEYNTVLKNGLPLNSTTPNNVNKDKQNCNHHSSYHHHNNSTNHDNMKYGNFHITGVNNRRSKSFNGDMGENYIKNNIFRADKDTNKDDVEYKAESMAQMGSVLNEVKSISSMLHDHNTVCDIERDWLDLRRVLDRLFFLLFLVIYVVSTVGLLYPVCSHHHC